MHEKVDYKESETNDSLSYHGTLPTIPALVSPYRVKFIYLSTELMVVQVSNYKTLIKEHYSRFILYMST